MKPHENLDPLVIGGKSYGSRLLLGTGKYKDFAETRAAVEASGAEMRAWRCSQGSHLRAVRFATARLRRAAGWC